MIARAAKTVERAKIVDAGSAMRRLIT